MNDGWMEQMTPEEEEAMIDQLAGVVGKRKLELPAILALEMHRPLGNIGSHATVAFAPFLVPFLGHDQVAGISRLLATPGGLDRLIERLDEQRQPASKDDNSSCST